MDDDEDFDSVRDKVKKAKQREKENRMFMENALRQGDSTDMADIINDFKLEGKMKVVHLLVVETITETLLKLGMATTEPLELQKDFNYLRALRETSQALKKKTFLTMTGVIITSILAFFVMQMKSYFG